jgi:Ca2+-binding RTX toxin-like protein
VIVDLTTQGLGQPQTIGADQGKDTLISIEAATGSKFNDTLTGDTNANNLFGIDGNDSLSGGGGADFLEGGAGNDTLSGKSLGDFVEASYEDAKVGAIVNLTNAVQAGVAALTAQDGLGGVDTLINIAGVLGSDFGDKFFGGDADEFFEPGGGDDTIDGGAGFDDVDYFSSSDAVNASLFAQGLPQLISSSQGTDTFTHMEDSTAPPSTTRSPATAMIISSRAATAMTACKAAPAMIACAAAPATTRWAAATVSMSPTTSLRLPPFMSI